MGRWPSQSLHLRCPSVSAADGRQERQVKLLYISRRMNRDWGSLFSVWRPPQLSHCNLLFFVFFCPRCRFLSLYKGPCHTHKVQRLNESTSYTFRIQAFNEAGEGPFSTVYTFTTPRSPPAPVKGRPASLLTSCPRIGSSLSEDLLTVRQSALTGFILDLMKSRQPRIYWVANTCWVPSWSFSHSTHSENRLLGCKVSTVSCNSFNLD